VLNIGDISDEIETRTTSCGLATFGIIQDLYGLEGDLDNESVLEFAQRIRIVYDNSGSEIIETGIEIPTMPEGCDDDDQ
jgi:hypothetical protein